jgi:hypothetical protein
MDGLIDLDSLSSGALVVNILLAIVLSLAVAWFYARYGEALSNRTKLARLFPVLCAIMVLVISVIKGSLALSLGLVGALSIVRFRTAIKDPEELIYLFLIIAIGLGLGAEQQIPTIIATAVIMLYLIIRRLTKPRSPQRNLYLNIQVPEQHADGAVNSVSGILGKYAQSVDLRRLDRRDRSLQLTYFLDFRKKEKLAELSEDLTDSMPDASFSFIDQDNMPL